MIVIIRKTMMVKTKMVDIKMMKTIMMTMMMTMMIPRKGTTARFIEDQDEKREKLVQFFCRNIHNK